MQYMGKCCLISIGERGRECMHIIYAKDVIRSSELIGGCRGGMCKCLEMGYVGVVSEGFSGWWSVHF